MTDFEHFAGKQYALAVAEELEEKISGLHTVLTDAVEGDYYNYNETFRIAVQIPIDPSATLSENDAFCGKTFEIGAVAYKTAETAANHPGLSCTLEDTPHYTPRYYERTFLFSRKRIPKVFIPCEDPDEDTQEMMASTELALKDKLKGFSVVKSEIDLSLKNHRIVLKLDTLDCDMLPYKKFFRLLQKSKNRIYNAVASAVEKTDTICVLLEEKIGVNSTPPRPVEFPHFVVIFQRVDFGIYTSADKWKNPCPSCGKIADIVDSTIGYCRRCGLSMKEHWNIEAIKTHADIFLHRVGAGSKGGWKWGTVDTAELK